MHGKNRWMSRCRSKLTTFSVLHSVLNLVNAASDTSAEQDEAAGNYVHTNFKIYREFKRLRKVRSDTMPDVHLSNN